MTHPTRAHLILAAGQSNMAGCGLPLPDPPAEPDPRIWQYGATRRVLEPAVDPLDMVGGPAEGVGPSVAFAEGVAAMLPTSEMVVIVPAALGGTPLVDATSADAWQWDGQPDNLAARALIQTREAMDAARRAWPGAAVEVAAILWGQGERDGHPDIRVGGEEYRTALEQLIDGFRASLGGPPIPVVIGQMVPETLASGTRAQIDAAHRAVAEAVPMSGFAPGPAGRHNGDELHYDAEGQQLLAQSMIAVWQRLTGARPR